ncbi:MAG TPA: glycosyltransferase family 1 protein [Mycobacteriales bacterium]|nr:glycosyltransferase family 1 protein [Mycobacteriales bacterium]
MRVAVITESFLPQVNGVTNSVLRVCEQMQRHGHPTLVVAPGPGPTSYAGATVVRTPSVRLPGYRDFRLGRPWPLLARTLREFEPDVVHLASPAALGAQGAYTAHRLGVPLVAVYQTDLAGFARRYGLRGTEEAVWRYLRRVHGNAARTLAPSRHAVDELRRNGVARVRRWARGVDTVRFSPRHRDDEWRRRFARPGELLVGYVGRLAHEKEVGLLAAVRDLPGTRLVVVGDGPQRAALQQQLPGVPFLGLQTGEDLSRAFASLDVFVHTGAAETFCQAAQEALASGLPVVAPGAGGLLDLVDPGHTGLLFRPGDGVDLRAQVERLRDDADARLRMGWAARLSVQHRTWDVIGDQLVQHYAAVVEDGPAALELAA